MPDKDVMVQIKALEDQLGWRALDGTMALGVTLDVKLFVESLRTLAEDWRTLADLYDKAKGKGFKTLHIDPLRHAAGQLDKVIKQLEQPRRAPLGQLQQHPTGPAAVHRFEVGEGGTGRTCMAMVQEEDGSGDQCGQLPGAHVHNLAALGTIRTGTGASTESLDALIADSVARHRGEVRDDDGSGVVIVDRTGLDRDAPPTPDFPGQVTGDEVAAYLSGALDDLPDDFGPPLQPSSVTDATETTFTGTWDGPEWIFKGAPMVITEDAPPFFRGMSPEQHGEVHYDPADFAAAQNEEFDREERALQQPIIPPVPLLGQPGDAGAGYAADYVPPNGVKATYAELMTMVPVAALPPHLSHSQGNGVSQCPAQYRLTRIGRGPSVAGDLPQVPQWANVGGSALHAVIEKCERIWASNPADPFDVVTADEEADRLWAEAFDAEIAKLEASTPIPRSRWRAANKGAEGETWWRANGPEMIKRYLKVRPDEPTASFSIGPNSPSMDPAIEIERTVEVPTPYGPIAYRAIIDRVTVRAGDQAVRDAGQPSFPTLVIRDYKTGGGWTQTQQQLGEYANVLRLLGVPPQVKIVGTYFNARKGEWSPEVDLEAAGYTAEWFAFHVTSKHAERLALTTGPTPVRPSSLCAACPVRWACPAGALR